MSSDAVTMLKCKCERCRHEWITRTKEEPRVCPKCKNPYWNKPKKTKAKNDDLFEKDMQSFALKKINNYLSKIEKEGITGENKYKYELTKILKEGLMNG